MQENFTENPIILAEVFLNEGYWRWRIMDAEGREYVDGGNFTRQEQALDSLEVELALLRERP